MDWSWFPPLLAGVLLTLASSTAAALLVDHLQEGRRSKERRIERLTGRLYEIRRYMMGALRIADLTCGPALRGIHKLDGSDYAVWSQNWVELAPGVGYLPAGGSPAVMLTRDRQLLDLMDQVRPVMARLALEAERLAVERVVALEPLGDRDQLCGLAGKIRDRCDQLEDQE